MTRNFGYRKSTHDNSRKVGLAKQAQKLNIHSLLGAVYSISTVSFGRKKWKPSDKNRMRQMTSPRLSIQSRICAFQLKDAKTSKTWRKDAHSSELSKWGKTYLATKVVGLLPFRTCLKLINLLSRVIEHLHYFSVSYARKQWQLNENYQAHHTKKKWLTLVIS